MWKGTRLIVATVAGIVVLALAGVGVGLAVTGGTRGRSTAGSQRYGHTPSYTLTDQHGRRFDSSRLHGKVQVVSYLFPYCTSYCPLIARNLAQTEQLVAKRGLRGKVAFVTFNVDPGGAGPAVLAKFLKQEEIDPNDPAWHYLTGTPEQVSHVVRDGFHVYYQKVTLKQEKKAEAQQKKAGTYQPEPEEPNAIAAKAHVEYDIVHNDTVEIADPNGVIRTFIDSGDTASPQRIFAAIEKALSR